MISFTHHVQLGQDTNRTFTHWISATCHHQCIRGYQIDVRWRHRQDQAILVADVLNDDVIDLLHDVSGLSLRWNFDHAGQINQGQIDD